MRSFGPDANSVPATALVRCWLPDDPAHKIGGTWTLIDGAAGILTLASSLPRHIVGTATASSYEILHIESADKLVFATCLSCVEEGASGRMDGARQDRAQTLSVETALWGACLTRDDLVFREVHFSTKSLADWAFPGSYARIESHVDKGYAHAEYRRPDTHTATLGSVTLELVADANPIEHGKARGNSSVLLQEDATFRLRWPEPQPWGVIRAVCVRLAHLVTLAARQANPPIALRLSGDALGTQMGEHVVPGFVTVVDEGIRPEATPQEFAWQLFELREAPGGWEALSRRWFELYVTVGVSLELLVSLRVKERESLYAVFFAVCQMLEGYHRVQAYPGRLPRADYRVLKQTLLKNCPEEHLDWFNNLLSHGNESSLRERVEMLTARAGHAGEDLVRFRPEFAYDLAGYRNDYAHILKPHETPADLELLDLVRAAEWTMVACVLRDLGWDDADVWALLTRNPSYQSAVRPLLPIKPRRQNKTPSGGASA